jgi:hypothetical protein
MTKVANAYYVTHKDSNFERYVQFIRNLRTVNRQSWIDGWNGYREYREAAASAWEAKDEAAFAAAIEVGRKVCPHFERINDYFLLGYIYQDLGRLATQNRATEEAKSNYDQAKTYFEAFGAKDKVMETQGLLDQLAQGELQTAADIERERRDAEARAAAEAELAPLWKETPLTYRSSEKFDYVTPGPLSTEEYVNWAGARVESGKFGPFYDAFSFEVATFMGYYSSDDGIGIRPRATSPLVRYQIMNEDKKMYLDLNDDGEIQKDERIEVTGRPTFHEFQLQTADEKPFRYAVMMCELKEEKFFGFNTRYGEGSLRWQRACWMQGEAFDGRPVVLIDDDSNGTYNDYGADAIVVGKGKRADFLSEIVRVEGELYRVQVDDVLGATIRTMPFSGPTGMVEVHYKGPILPESLYIRGAGGDLKRVVLPLLQKTAVKVPVGKWVFYYGSLRDGKGRNASLAEIRKGKSEAFEVNENATTVVELGAPFTFDYEVKADGNNSVLRGRDLRVFGSRGELYTRFYPEVPRGDVIVMVGKGGVVTKEKLKPIDQGIFNTSSDQAWFPRDVSWQSPGKDLEYRCRIRAKHGLLGNIVADVK